MEIPEEAFLLIGQSLSRDPSIQNMNSLEEKKQHTILFVDSKTMSDNIVQSANDEKEGTEEIPADATNESENSADNNNHMMNSAILVRADMDDAHSIDKDSFTYSLSTPSGQDQETESVVTDDTSENYSVGVSDDDYPIPPLEPCDNKKGNENNPDLDTTNKGEKEEEEEEEETEYPMPDLIENFTEPLSATSPLCDYTVYEQPQLQPQSTPKCIYKQDASLSSHGRTEVVEGAWWDIVDGHDSQPTGDR